MGKNINLDRNSGTGTTEVVILVVYNFCICGTTLSNTFSRQSNEFMISMEYDVYYFRYNLHCMRIRFFFSTFSYTADGNHVLNEVPGIE